MTAHDPQYEAFLERVLVVVLLAFLLALGSCFRSSLNLGDTCNLAARTATLRDSVALNNAGCSLRIAVTGERP